MWSAGSVQLELEPAILSAPENSGVVSRQAETAGLRVDWTPMIEKLFDGRGATSMAHVTISRTAGDEAEHWTLSLSVLSNGAKRGRGCHFAEARPRIGARGQDDTESRNHQSAGIGLILKVGQQRLTD